MKTGTCAREYQRCDLPAGGFRGTFPALCSKHARARVVGIDLLRRARRKSLLGGGR
jgi:hypothetical protein